jgi:thioredoxin 1
MNKWHKLLIIAALIGAVVFVVEYKKRQGFVCAGGVCVPTVSDKAGAVQQTNTPLPRLVDLGAGKCSSCKMMSSVLDELKTTCTGKLDIVFIDVWENQQAGEQYGIRMIPTQIFYDAEGKELFRHEGFISKDDILAKWKELGVVL